MNSSCLKKLITDSSENYPRNTFTTGNRFYTFVNPYSYLLLRKRPELLEKADGVFVDGISMCLWIRLFWGKKIARRSFDMTSVAKDLFEECEKTGKSIYFIGSKKEEVEKAVEVIKESYSKINILGFRDGYIKDETDKQLTVESIKKLNPAFLIVGMGTPRQEQFAIEAKESGYKGIIFTCGGFLHQTAGGLNYYPDWVDKYNLRGFYRQCKEKGIVKRNYDTFIVFPFVFLLDTIKSRLKKK